MIEEFKAALQEVAKVTGRRGDTVMVHITPEEEKYLEREFGGSTTNPVTGLKEYAGEPGAGRGGAGEGGFGGSDRGGGDSSGGGGRGGFGGSRGDPRGGMTERDAPSNLGRAAGPAGPAVGRGRGRGTPGRSGSDAPSDMRGGVGGQPSSSLGRGTGASSDAGRSISRALSAMMSLGFGLPASALSIVDPEKDLVGVPAALRDIAQTLGTVKDKGLEALGLESARGPGAVDVADPQGPTGVGMGPPSGVPAGGGDFTPVNATGQLDFSLSRPEAMERPYFLGMGDAMTPLQQRAHLATYGTGGEAGTYRSEPAQEYFRNLFLRSIMDDQGGILPGAQVLPVEAQYAGNMGFDVTPEMSVENFARALSGLPSSEQVAEYMAAWQPGPPRVKEGPA